MYTSFCVKYIKAERIKWRGHVDRMEDLKVVKKVTDLNPMGIRTEGRPKTRRRDECANRQK